MSEFTPAQLAHFKRFERVRLSGRFNMFDPRARAATGLTREQFIFVLENYSEMRDAAEAEEKE